MTKNVEVTVNMETARRMLRIAGYDVTGMTDDEIFVKALSMSEKYGVKYTNI